MEDEPDKVEGEYKYSDPKCPWCPCTGIIKECNTFSLNILSASSPPDITLTKIMLVLSPATSLSTDSWEYEISLKLPFSPWESGLEQ
jgi:hypothetical protein